MKVKFDKYLVYEELVAILQNWAKEFPELCKLEVIGESYEKRPIYAMTVTDFSTGDDMHKPALYVDANIHAGEVTGSMAALHLIQYLLHENNDKVRHLLKTRAFYILPRINPDGAELYLTTPYTLRSSVRPFPLERAYEDPPGLHEADINNDGKILQMRVRDDLHGAWKLSSEDSRLLIPREPYDYTGEFYHLYTEGYILNEDGEKPDTPLFPFRSVPTKYGLDLNRNFPAGHDLHTPGSGPYPLSEPETESQVRFIDKKRNIAGVLLYHTTGGVLFRPHSTIPDKDFHKKDIELYEAIGQIGTEVTGYPTVCCYGDIWSGVLDDWCFEKKGLFAFTPELWDVVGRAAPNVNKADVRKLSKEDSIKLDLAILRWNDQELSGTGFIPWQKFEHPQLGEVEIGGWDRKECRQNPPIKYLERECYNMTQFSLNYALSLPQVEIEELTAEQIGPGVYNVSVMVANRGFLSTNISEQAKKQKVVRPDLVRINLPESCTLSSGEKQHELGFLEGYFASQTTRPFSGGSAYRHNWTVIKDSDQPLKIGVELISERGGHKISYVELN